jgi:hypothetical protein
MQRAHVSAEVLRLREGSLLRARFRQRQLTAYAAHRTTHQEHRAHQNSIRHGVELVLNSPIDDKAAANTTSDARDPVRVPIWVWFLSNRSARPQFGPSDLVEEWIGWLLSIQIFTETGACSEWNRTLPFPVFLFV